MQLLTGTRARMSPSLELRPPQRRARLRLGRRSGASSRDRDGLSVPLRPAFVLASSPSSLGITAVSLCPVSDSHPESPPPTSIREHRRRSSRVSVSSPRGRIRSMVAVVQVLSSVSVCPGTAHAPVRVDVSSTTKMLRLATIVRLAIIWQSSSSSGST
nr:uncharacterized protein LOC127323539 isoform X2 [Lolium perenne]